MVLGKNQGIAEGKIARLKKIEEEKNVATEREPGLQR